MHVLIALTADPNIAQTRRLSKQKRELGLGLHPTWSTKCERECESGRIPRLLYIAIRHYQSLMEAV